MCIYLIKKNNINSFVYYFISFKRLKKKIKIEYIPK